MKTTLNQMFGHLNRELFEGKLSQPTIEFSLNRPFVIRWEVKGNILHIGRGIVRCDFNELAVELVHEMIHIFNNMRGIEDQARNQYHNKYFMESALNFGFYVQQHKRHGWSITTIHRPSSQAILYTPNLGTSSRLVHTLKNLSEFVINYKNELSMVHSLIKDAKPAKCYFLKYCCQCPPPYNSIRSGRRPDSKNALDILCNKCGEPFLHN